VMCHNCGKGLSGGKYAISNGHPIHLTCMHGAQVAGSQPASEFDENDTCAKCRQRIQGQRKTVPGFGHFHLTCFKCVRCGLGIRTDQKYVKDDATGQPVCSRCL
jgi:hypothetical protein